MTFFTRSGINPMRNDDNDLHYVAIGGRFIAFVAFTCGTVLELLFFPYNHSKLTYMSICFF